MRNRILSRTSDAARGATDPDDPARAADGRVERRVEGLG
jgi:hypothetical protein